jgi:hypothetical protein
MQLIPNSWGSSIREYNSNHEPGGTAKGGQFAKTSGAAPLSGTRPVIENIPDRVRANVEAWREKTGNTRKVLAKRIQALYDRATPEQRRDGATWYPDAHKEAERLAREYGVTPQQAAGVIAALSPLREWGENKADAERLLTSVINGTADPSVAKLLQANVEKATAITKGADPRDVLWSGGGFKVRSFYSNLNDPAGREATIDTHMLRVLLADQSIASKDYGGIAGNVGRYDAFRQAIFDVADKEKVSPATVQAIVWLVQKGEHSSRRSVGSRLKAALPHVPDNRVLALLLDAVAVLFGGSPIREGWIAGAIKRPG